MINFVKDEKICLVIYQTIKKLKNAVGNMTNFSFINNFEEIIKTNFLNWDIRIERTQLKYIKSNRLTIEKEKTLFNVLS